MTHEYLRGVDTIHYQGGMKDETVMFDPTKFQDLDVCHPDSPCDLTVSAMTCTDEGSGSNPSMDFFSSFFLLLFILFCT